MANEIERIEFLIRDRITKVIIPYYIAAASINLGDENNYVSLPERLEQMAQAIRDASSSYSPPEGGIPADQLSAEVQALLTLAGSAVQNVDSELDTSSSHPVKNSVVATAIAGLQRAVDLLTNTEDASNIINSMVEVTDFLAGITNDQTLTGKLYELQQSIDAKQATIADLENIRSGAAASATALQPSDVSVDSNEDGTFDINVKNDKYTVNLNHTHEHMAKLVVCEESDLPSTLPTDTIFAQVDNVSTPTEVQKLFIAGCEFEKGWVPDNGEAVIKSPSNGTTIELGEIDQGSASKTIIVRGWNLTGALTVVISGTGLSMNYGQLTGQTSITIPQAAALTGAAVEIVYSGNDGIDDGGLVISQGNDVLSQVVVTAEAYEVPLKAVKLLGEQAFVTDWNLTTLTDVTMKVKFTANANSYDSTQTERWYFLSEPYSNDNTNYPKYYLYLKGVNGSANPKFFIQIKANTVVGVEVPANKIETDESVLTMLHTGAFSFVPGGNQSAYSVAAAAIPSRSTPLIIGGLTNYENPTTLVSNKAMNKFYMTIYEITIKENDVVKRHYLPYRVHGVPGLLDEVTGQFIRSCTGVDVEAVELS